MSDDEMPPEAVPLDMHNGDLDHLVEEQHNQPSAPMVQDIGTKVEQVPVMLLTGFLGSGKTTLINYILTQNHGYRCAVLLNEFADSADIEKALIKEPEVSYTILPNPTVHCCVSWLSVPLTVGKTDTPVSIRYTTSKTVPFTFALTTGK